MLDTITRADFEGYVGQSLRVRIGEAETEAEVTEVRALQSPSPRAEPFSVTLRVDASLPYGQGIHRLEHPTRGALELFMVPIGPDARGMRYEIVFN